MLKLNLGKESKLVQKKLTALSLWDSLSKSRCQVTKVAHSMHYIKKGFDCKKKQDLVWDCTHTKKAVLIKTGFTCIKKVFPAQRKQKKRKAFLPTVDF